jgi:hypothetical protein
MSKFEVIAVAILASPVLLHLLKRFLPVKPDPKDSTVINFNGPVYYFSQYASLPANKPPRSLRLETKGGADSGPKSSSESN